MNTLKISNISNLGKYFDKKRFRQNLFIQRSFGILALLLILALVPLQNMNDVSAFTQFYLALPDIIDELDGIAISVEISDYKNSTVVSWTNNGSMFVPDNSTVAVEPRYNLLHLDENDYLLAINDTVDPGTRLYICADIPYPNKQHECQWDAVDNNQTVYAEFDFYFQSP